MMRKRLLLQSLLVGVAAFASGTVHATGDSTFKLSDAPQPKKPVPLGSTGGSTFKLSDAPQPPKKPTPLDSTGGSTFKLSDAPQPKKPTPLGSTGGSTFKLSDAPQPKKPALSSGELGSVLDIEKQKNAELETQIGKLRKDLTAEKQKSTGLTAKIEKLREALVIEKQKNLELQGQIEELKKQLEAMSVVPQEEDLIKKIDEVVEAFSGKLAGESVVLTRKTLEQAESWLLEANIVEEKGYIERIKQIFAFFKAQDNAQDYENSVILSKGDLEKIKRYILTGEDGESVAAVGAVVPPPPPQQQQQQQQQQGNVVAVSADIEDILDEDD